VWGRGGVSFLDAFYEEFYLYSGMFEVFGFVARLVYRLAFPAYDDDGFTSSRGGAWYGE